MVRKLTTNMQSLLPRALSEIGCGHGSDWSRIEFGRPQLRKIRLTPVVSGHVCRSLTTLLTLNLVGFDHWNQENLGPTSARRKGRSINLNKYTVFIDNCYRLINPGQLGAELSSLLRPCQTADSLRSVILCPWNQPGQAFETSDFIAKHYLSRNNHDRAHEIGFVEDISNVLNGGKIQLSKHTCSPNCLWLLEYKFSRIVMSLYFRQHVHC